jgi:hypothetical protein
MKVLNQSNQLFAAYMSLIVDAIKLSTSAKEHHNLHYLFKTTPSMNIVKLSISTLFQKRYHNIGVLMIKMTIEFTGAMH